MEELSHEEAVERIKLIDGDQTMGRFEMGDIALRRAPISLRSVHNDSTDELVRLAEDSGVSANTLEERRFVASRTTALARARAVSWSVYREIAKIPDENERTTWLHRINEEPPPTYIPCGRWTVDAIRMERGKRPTHRQDPLEAPALDPIAANEELYNEKEFGDAISAEASDVMRAQLGSEAYDRLAVQGDEETFKTYILKFLAYLRSNTAEVHQRLGEPSEVYAWLCNQISGSQRDRELDSIEEALDFWKEVINTRRRRRLEIVS